jgi:hypothetical protein
VPISREAYLTPKSGRRACIPVTSNADKMVADPMAYALNGLRDL